MIDVSREYHFPAFKGNSHARSGTTPSPSAAARVANIWHGILLRRGQKTAVVERRWVGGSCPNINCFPSKNAPQTVHASLNDGGTRRLVAEKLFLNLDTRASLPPFPASVEAQPLTNIETLERYR